MRENFFQAASAETPETDVPPAARASLSTDALPAARAPLSTDAPSATDAPPSAGMPPTAGAMGVSGTAVAHQTLRAELGDATDMTAAAKASQRLDSIDAPGWTKLAAPAKVNLHLGVGSRRSDGYHDVDTILHALNLHDSLYMRRLPQEAGSGLAVDVLTLGCGGVQAPVLEACDNIVYRAVHELARRSGYEADELIEVRLEKRIPFEAGLGGGSSDAAAALVGAAHFWDIDPLGPEVLDAARSLGSDVAFFLRGGCAYCTGGGDVIMRELTPLKQSIVLVKPSSGVSTAEAYRAFDSAPIEVGLARATAVRAAERAQDVELFNNLAPAAESLLPELSDVREWMCAQPGVRAALLCGSGSTTFAVCGGISQACDIVARARARGWWARATALGPMRACMVR